MADSLGDPWIASHSPISPEKMHAIGCLVFYWNLCEFDAKHFFWLALGGTNQAATIVSHDMGDRTIWEKTLLLMQLRGFRPELVDRVEHGSKLHERCNTNRNAFVHFVAGGSPEPSDDGSILRLARQKGPVFNPVPLHDQLATMRRVADDCSNLHLYLTAIWTHEITFRHSGDHPEQNARFPLPDKPPLPELVWTIPPKTQAKRKRQPQSSPA